MVVESRVIAVAGQIIFGIPPGFRFDGLTRPACMVVFSRMR